MPDAAWAIGLFGGISAALIFLWSTRGYSGSGLCKGLAGDAGFRKPQILGNFGSGNADLRESDRGSSMTHTWHAVPNPRMRNSD